MKFGPIEGTREEIKGFMQDNGLQAQAFFQVPEQPIGNWWIVVSAAIVACSGAVMTLAHLALGGATTFAFLVGCGGAVWLATIIQLRFKSLSAAIGVFVLCVLLLLVALGVLLPADLPDEARKWKR